MAPPITRHSPPGAGPAPVGRRRADRAARRLALTALTVGVPFALVTIFGLPIPHSMPSLSVLTHRLDVFAVIKVLWSWSGWPGSSWCSA